MYIINLNKSTKSTYFSFAKQKVLIWYMCTLQKQRLLGMVKTNKRGASKGGVYDKVKTDKEENQERTIIK